MGTRQHGSMDRRSFLGVIAAGAALAPLALAGCGSAQQSDSTASTTATAMRNPSANAKTKAAPVTSSVTERPLMNSGAYGSMTEKFMPLSR